MANKIIISCALTGSIHTPTMSDALPITPDQIATQAIDAASAGAAILHLHARDPKDGRPSPDPNVFMQFLPRIKQATDAVVNITTGGAVTMTVEQRISAAQTLSPEMCSLNMGSMNFALYPMAKRYKSWKYHWEESYLTNSDAYIFPNTFRDIEKISRFSARATASNSSMNATTPATCTISPIASIAACSSRRFSCSSSSAFSAASAPTSTICCS